MLRFTSDDVQGAMLTMLAEACAAPLAPPCACSRSAYASLARRSTPAVRRTDSDRPAQQTRVSS